MRTKIPLARGGQLLVPVHALASRADDCLKGVTVIAILFSVPLHIKAGMRAAKNESAHSVAFYFSGLKT